MDTLQFLKDDHEKIRRLFDQIAEADDDAEQRLLFDELRDELIAHSFVEETVFYPAFSAYESLADLLDDSFEDHEEMKDCVVDIEDTRPAGTVGDLDEGNFLDQIEDLRDLVDEHFETEELDLFPRVTDVLSAEELNRLGHLMLDAREGLRRKTKRAA